MRTLKEIVQDINLKSIEATADPANFNPQVFASVQGLARAATLALQDLEREYKAAILPTVKVIAVVGARGKEFGEVVKYTTNTPVFDYMEPVKRIIADIRRRGFGPSFTNQEFFAALTVLSAMNIEQGMSNRPTPIFNVVDGLVYEQPIEKAAKNLITTNYGTSLFDAALTVAIQNSAYNSRFAAKMYPALVYGFDVEPVGVAACVVVPDTGDIKEIAASAMAKIKTKLTKRTKEENTQAKEEGEAQ